MSHQRDIAGDPGREWGFYFQKTSPKVCIPCVLHHHLKYGALSHRDHGKRYNKEASMKA
ncbi:hypothetical protein ACFLUZ_01365 [Chloroflexota bacterium]